MDSPGKIPEIKPGDLPRLLEGRGFVDGVVMQVGPRLWALEHNGRPWLIFEDANYHPMYHLDRMQQERYQEQIEQNDYPFCTEASQIFIDLEAGRYIEREFYAEEGEIQGVEYAWEAITHGGVLEEAAYHAYIAGLLQEIGEETIPTDWSTLTDMQESDVERLTT